MRALVCGCEGVLDMVVCEEPGISGLCWQEVNALSRKQTPMLRKKGMGIVGKLGRESVASRFIFAFFSSSLSTERTEYPHA